MNKKTRRQFSMNLLYSVSAIGIGLGLYEGRVAAFLLGCLAYGWGYIIAWKVDND